MEARAMPINQQPDSGFFSWLTPARRNLVAVFLLGLFVGYAGGNGHTTGGAIEHISQQLGDAKVAAKCEHAVAQKSQAIAKQAIVAANVPEIAAPDPSVLPADKCPPVKK